jgi:lambda repressor-like predicted transcriptional regulator
MDAEKESDNSQPSLDIKLSGLPERLKTAIGGSSLRFVAQQSGVSEGTLRNILSGSMPRVDNLAQIASTLHVSVEWLATGGWSIPKFKPPKEVVEAVQEMRGFIEEILDHTNMSYSEHDKTIDRDELIENEALAYVEQLATMALNKQGHLTSTKMGDEYSTVQQFIVEPNIIGDSIAKDEIERIAFRNEWLNLKGFTAKDLVTIRISGDSMVPTIKDGALVLVDTSKKHPKDDGIYILQNNGNLLAKRMQVNILTSGISILSDNPAYNSIQIDKAQTERLEIIGKVVWVGQEV